MTLNWSVCQHPVARSSWPRTPCLFFPSILFILFLAFSVLSILVSGCWMIVAIPPNSVAWSFSSGTLYIYSAIAIYTGDSRQHKREKKNNLYTFYLYTCVLSRWTERNKGIPLDWIPARRITSSAAATLFVVTRFSLILLLIFHSMNRGARWPQTRRSRRVMADSGQRVFAMKNGQQQQQQSGGSFY